MSSQASVASPTSWRVLMPDISMCANGLSCELRDTCYRYVAKSSRYQSYIAPPDPGKDCEYYWPTEERAEE